MMSAGDKLKAMLDQSEYDFKCVSEGVVELIKSDPPEQSWYEESIKDLENPVTETKIKNKPQKSEPAHKRQLTPSPMPEYLSHSIISGNPSPVQSPSGITDNIIQEFNSIINQQLPHSDLRTELIRLLTLIGTFDNSLSFITGLPAPIDIEIFNGIIISSIRDRVSDDRLLGRLEGANSYQASHNSKLLKDLEGLLRSSMNDIYKTVSRVEEKSASYQSEKVSTMEILNEIKDEISELKSTVYSTSPADTSIESPQLSSVSAPVQRPKIWNNPKPPTNQDHWSLGPLFVQDGILQIMPDCANKTWWREKAQLLKPLRMDLLVELKKYPISYIQDIFNDHEVANQSMLMQKLSFQY